MSLFSFIRDAGEKLFRKPGAAAQGPVAPMAPARGSCPGQKLRIPKLA